VVIVVAEEDVRNITDAALPVGIILAGTRLPTAVIIDVGLPRWVVVAQGPSRDNWDRVLQVSDTNKTIQSAVDEIGELLVSYLEKQRSGIGMGLEESDGNVTHTRHSVSVEPNGASRHIELQVDGLDEGESTA